MNAVLLLMGLLVLSYLGSLLVAGRTARGAGLPSGVEYAALGFVLGPRALDIVGADMLEAFRPVVEVALGWLAFAVGLGFAHAGERRVRAASLALGSASALLTGGAVAAAVWATAGALRVALGPIERLLLAGGIGAACSDTTRHAVRWVVDRQTSRGPLAERLDEMAQSDQLFPLLAVSVLLALEPTRSVSVPWALRDWPTITVALGLLVGAGGALLLRSELRLEDAWGLLFGLALLAIGASARLALSTLTASFFMGIALATLSRHREDLRALVEPTERPVLLPALLLAGARLDFRASDALPWIAAAAVGARLAAKLFMGWTLAATSPAARRGGPLVGLSLASSGTLGMCIGLAFELRFPGTIGDSVLAVAVLAATAGEFVGPARLRRALENAGELTRARGPALASKHEAEAGIAP